MTPQQLDDLKKLTANLLQNHARDIEQGQPTFSTGWQEDFKAQARDIKCAALEFYYTGDPAGGENLSQTLLVIQFCALQVNTCRKLANTRLTTEKACIVTDVLYQYEYQLTLLYSWILKRFYKLVNHDRILPPLFLESNRQSINLLVQRVSAVMRQRKIPHSLTAILLTPLQEFLCLNRPPSVAEFEKIWFYRKAVRALMEAEIINKATLCRLLQEHGCNSLSFFNWLTKYLETYAAGYREDKQKLAFYQYQLKSCRQHQCCSNYLYVDGPTGKQLIDNWLSCEIDYLRQQMATGKSREKLEVESNVGSAKARLNLTVAELSCLTRFMVEAGIIKTDNFADVIRRVCSLVQTGRADKISPYSFLKKAQNIEPGTIDVVKGHLSKMLTLVRHHGQAS